MRKKNEKGCWPKMVDYTLTSLPAKVTGKHSLGQLWALGACKGAENPSYCNDSCGKNICEINFPEYFLLRSRISILFSLLKWRRNPDHEHGARLSSTNRCPLHRHAWKSIWGISRLWPTQRAAFATKHRCSSKLQGSVLRSQWLCACLGQYWI